MNLKGYFLVYCLLTFSVITIFSQTEKPELKVAIKNFTCYFNHNRPDSIYYLFSRDMKKGLTFELIQTKLTGLKQQLGDIKSCEFIRYESASGVYKLQFSSGIMALNLSVDDSSKINGLLFKPYIPENLPVMERNTTRLILPFEKEWTVVWGGDTRETNYHIVSQAQKNAFDFVITDENGKSFRTNGQSNEDYYCFGEKIISPCDGVVVMAVDGIKDNTPAKMNSTFITGNTVVLKTAKGEFIYLCHFKNHSVAVKEGQQVKQGELLGLCGNSGHSSEAHLHFHIQNVEDMETATGAKCYFGKIIVNGKQVSDYSPVKGEKIKN
jgi:hypothetical protein